MKDSQSELIEKAKEHLKSKFGEDTVMMTVKDNSVTDGTGTLSVDCTVSVSGQRSNWSKKFHFEKGKIVDMDAWPK